MSRRVLSQFKIEYYVHNIYQVANGTGGGIRYVSLDDISLFIYAFREQIGGYIVLYTSLSSNYNKSKVQCQAGQFIDYLFSVPCLFCNFVIILKYIRLSVY